jgi:hypothetical protein
MAKEYVPDCVDLVWLDFDPQAGREQAGHRPGLVLSPKSYNEKVGLALCCPITNQEKGYPFEVRLDGGLPVTGLFSPTMYAASIGASARHVASDRLLRISSGSSPPS